MGLSELSPAFLPLCSKWWQDANELDHQELRARYGSEWFLFSDECIHCLQRMLELVNDTNMIQFRLLV